MPGKIYFRYGAMNSSKSLNLLANAHNYEENKRNVLCLKPQLDTRDIGIIKSRAGIKRSCVTIGPSANLYDYLMSLHLECGADRPDIIFIDEVQFLTEDQMMQLIKAIDEFEYKVMCYGLKSDYTGKLFPAVEKLMVFADDIQEIKTICKYCDRKAIMNLRVVDNQPVYTGESIKIGDVNRVGSIQEVEEYYVPTCRYHYFNPSC